MHFQDATFIWFKILKDIPFFQVNKSEAKFSSDCLKLILVLYSARLTTLLDIEIIYSLQKDIEFVQFVND